MKYIARFFTCQQVKVVHQHPAILLKHIPIPEWKLKRITMDFITGLPKTKRHNDSIMVVLVKLSKETHFILIKSNYKVIIIFDKFMKYIFILHGILKIVITDRDAKFTSNLWTSLSKSMDTKLNFGTTYHPQTNEPKKWVNQILEYMLRLYVMNQPSKWEDYIYLVEFA